MTRAIRLLGDLPPRAVLAVFLGALVVRLANAYGLAGNAANFFREDAVLYWSAAQFVLDHGGFDPPPEGAGASGRERVPLYILFVAGMRALFGDSPIAVVLAQCAIDAGSCVLIMRLGAFLGPRIGVLSGALAAIWSNLVVHSAALLSDTLFVFVFCLALLGGARYLEDARPARALVAGLLCGAAIMVRTVAQFLPLAMAAAAPVVALVARRGLRSGLAASVLALVGAALAISPWVYANLRDHGVVALTTQEGVHLAAWILPLVRQSVDGTPHAEGAKLYRDRYVEELRAEGLDPERMAPFELSRRLSGKAMADLAAMPTSAVALAWAKGAAINLAAPGIALDPRIRRAREGSLYNDTKASLFGRLGGYFASTAPALRPLSVLGAVLSALTLVLQVVGFARLVRHRPWAGAAVFGLILYVLLVTGPIYSPKYRLPLEPILIVLTALGASGLRRRPHELALPPPSTYVGRAAARPEQAPRT